MLDGGIFEKTGKFTDIKHLILGTLEEFEKKTGDFKGFRHSRVRKSRDSRKNGEIHGYQTLETGTLEEFVKKTGDFTGFRHSRVRKSRDS